MDPKCEKCDYSTKAGTCIIGRDVKKCTSPELRKGVHLSSQAFVLILSKNFFLISVALAILMVLIVGGVAFTCTPGFCSWCHEMKADYTSWKTSVHRNVDCITCHVEPGLANLIKDKATVAPRSLVLKLTGNYEKPINKESKMAKEFHSENCLQCHTLKREISPSKGIKMNHLAHVELGMKCTQCHNRVAHEIKEYKDFSSMKGCFNCHDGNVISNQCVVCHTEGFLLEHKAKQ